MTQPRWPRATFFLASVALLCGMHLVLTHEHVLDQWLLHPAEVDRHLSGGELAHYVLLFVFGLPAAVFLMLAIPESLWERMGRIAERGSYPCAAIVAGVAALCLSQFVTQGAWFTDDEQAYLFQMKTYRQMRFTVPALQPKELFPHTFVFVSRVKDGVEHWTGVYPVLQPALMALSSLLGTPLLGQWLSVSGVSFGAGKLTEALTGERKFGLVAAWLCATSPMLVGLGASYHNSVPTCFLSIMTVLGWRRIADVASTKWAILVGLAAGAAFLVRPLEGALLLGCSGVFLIIATWRDRRACARVLAGFGLAAALPLSAYLITNRAITEEWLTSGYIAWGRRFGTLMGFGERMMFGRSHSLTAGIAQTFIGLTRLNTWLFGWPLGLLGVALALCVPLHTRATRWLLVFSGLHLLGYVPLAFGSVHTFGSAYHVFHVPFAAAIVACVLQSLKPRFVDALRLAAAMSVVGLLAFWPLQIRKWHRLARATLAPVELAQRIADGRKAIVLHRGFAERGVHTWVNHPPAPYPGDRLWWAIDAPGAEQRLRQRYPDRVLIRMRGRGVPLQAQELPQP